MQSFLNGKIVLHVGNCLDVMPTLAENSLDSCVTDPPYHLVSIVKRFGNANSAPINNTDEAVGRNGPYHRAAKGFMGKQWDGGDVAFRPETWAEVYRVLKPGAHLLAFGGTRTYHRMACAIEDAGFEIRDCIQWLYGSGFPKSHDVSKGIDRAAGVERRDAKHPGWGPFAHGSPRCLVCGKTKGSQPANCRCIDDKSQAATDAARQWEGWGTALKPAAEMIVVARKPLGTGDINVRRNVERGIRNRGFQGGISWKENAESAENPKRKSGSSKTASSGEISAETAAALQTENIRSADQKSSEVVTSDGTLRTSKTILPEHDEINKDCGRQYSLITENDASAAERQRQPSLLSTTSTGVGRHIGNPSADISTEKSSEADFQPITESFAGIATGLSDSQAHVLIKREGNLFVWPKNLPTFIPSKPLNVAANVLRWGTGVINVDGCRVSSSEDTGRPTGSLGLYEGGINGGQTISHVGGRWPANVIHDGSDEVLAGFPDSQSGTDNGERGTGGIWQASSGVPCGPQYGDTGSAARFFYTAKADSDDRIGSKHPTVKPLDLMQYLVRLITPKGGTVLDLFAGSGTTGEAAFREGMAAVLIEREAEYQTDIRRRVDLCMAGPDERSREMVKARGLTEAPGPLFEWEEMWRKPFDKPELVWGKDDEPHR